MESNSVCNHVINKIGRQRSGRPICLITSMISNVNRCKWRPISYAWRVRTVQLNCPKAEIRAIDSQSDLKILLKL